MAKHKETAEATQAGFRAHFGSALEGAVFEERALALADDLLPPVARRVRDGQDAGPEYWTWLIGLREAAAGREPNAAPQSGQRRARTIRKRRGPLPAPGKVKA